MHNSFKKMAAIIIATVLVVTGISIPTAALEDLSSEMAESTDVIETSELSEEDSDQTETTEISETSVNSQGTSANSQQEKQDIKENEDKEPSSGDAENVNETGTETSDTLTLEKNNEAPAEFKTFSAGNALSVSVSFDSDGGSDVEIQTLPGGEKAVRPEDPARKGCAFKGWYPVIDAAAGTVAETAFDFENTPITENVTLKALWEPLYVFILKAGEGTGEDVIISSDKEENWGEHDQPGKFFVGTDAIPRLTPPDGGKLFTAPEGKHFLGWLMDGDDKVHDTEYYYRAAGTITITAQWSAEHIIDWSLDTPIGATWQGGVDTRAMAGDIVPAILMVNKSDYAKGLRLTGILIEGKDIDAVLVTGIPPLNRLIAIPLGDQMMYMARFTMPDADVTVTALFNLVSVTFDSDGGSDVESQDMFTGEKADRPEDPVKKGCVFKGWYPVIDVETGTVAETAFDFENTPITEDATLKALWEPGSVVILQAGEGTGEDVVISSDKTENWGESDQPGKFFTSQEGNTFLTVPDGSIMFAAPKGQQFAGWKKSGDDTVYGTGSQVSGDVVILTAQWKAEPSPAVITAGVDKKDELEAKPVMTGDGNHAGSWFLLLAASIMIMLSAAVRLLRSDKK